MVKIWFFTLTVSTERWWSHNFLPVCRLLSLRWLCHAKAALELWRGFLEKLKVCRLDLPKYLKIITEYASCYEWNLWCFHFTVQSYTLQNSWIATCMSPIYVKDILIRFRHSVFGTSIRLVPIMSESNYLLFIVFVYLVA